MSFARSFRFISYLLAAIGFIGLGLVPGVHLFHTLLLLILTLLAYDLDRQQQYIHDSLVQKIVAVYAVVFLLDLAISGLVGALLRMVVVLQIIKIFCRKGTQDYLQIYLLSFMQVLFAAGHAFSLHYAMIFTFYCVAATTAFSLLYLRHQAEAYRLDWQRADLPQSYLAGAVLLSLFLFFFTGAIFLFLPRFGVLHISTGRIPILERPDLVTGFSRSIILGQVGQIQQNPQRVARVELPDEQQPLPYPIYLRAGVLDLYRQNQWEKRQGVPAVPLEADTRGTLDLGRHGFRVTGQAPVYHLNVYLEPLDTLQLFLPAYSFQVNSSFDRVFVSPDGEVSTTKLLRHGAFYRTATALGEPHAIAVQDHSLHSASGRSAYLRVPPEDSGFFSKYARELAAGRRTPMAKALAVESFLQTNYRYSLRLASTERPLHDFLRGQFAANCEYFASAMVLLLRSMGIPARVVTGFASDDWNAFGRFYSFYQKDAHAWVEAYIPDRGWVLFDPTPPAQSPEGFTLAQRFKQVYLAAEMRWFKYVVGYDRTEQRQVLARASARVGQLFRTFLRWPSEALLVVVVLPLMAAALTVGRLRRLPLGRALSRWRPSGSPQAARFVRRFLSMEFSLLSSSPSATSWEKGEALPSHVRPLYERTAAAYYAVRFGGAMPSGEDFAALARLRDLLPRGARRRAGGGLLRKP